MSILQTTDFEAGEFSLPLDNYSNLQTYLDKYEHFYLIRLLGKELFDLFIADLTVVQPIEPQTQIYKDIFEPIEEDEDNNLIVGEGMKEMLIQFVYFHFMRENRSQKTKSGTVEGVSENSTGLNYNGWNLVEAYNKAVENANVIQWYIKDNETIYPEFNGICFEKISGI